MAEDGKKPVSEEAEKPVAEASVVEEVVAVAEVGAPCPPQSEVPEAEEKSKEEGVVEKLEGEAAAAAAAEEEKPKVVEEGEKMTESVSFKEESNVVSDLPESQRKALEELKVLVKEAMEKHEFTAPPPPPPPPAKEEEKAPATEEEAKTEAPAEPAAEAECPPPVEESKKEEKKEEEKKEEEKKEKEKVAPPEPAEPEVVAVVVETITAVVVDEDGAKTVEAIEETIVVAPPTEEPAAAVEGGLPRPEEVEIWGIKLFDDDRTDVVLLKFLRARDFKPKESLTMLKNAVLWRKSFGIETLLEEDLGNHLESVVFMEGFGKEGHPVCYNAYGKFQNKELYQNTFSDEEKRQNFLRWRIQFLEKSIRKLDFSPKGINTIIQVNDLKNSPGPFKRELRQATNQALYLLQDNYPEFVAKQVFLLLSLLTVIRLHTACLFFLLCA